MEQIKETDIMIGNIVNLTVEGKDGVFNQNIVIEEIRKDVILFNNGIHAAYRMLRPIPLTEEILLKCGFKKCRKGYSLNIGGESFDYYIKDKFVLWYHKHKGYSLDAISKSSDRFYNYLHQLQNLFKMLTGNELEISL